MKNKVILITGGTGSFGKIFVNYALKQNPKKIIIFSRDELKQFEMRKNYNKFQLKKLRFFIGDVRDYERVFYALKQVDYVIHAAALKQIDTCEYNPFEAIKTNIIGAQNIINASIERNIKKVIALSTDKASSPINLYGATKLASDKLFISANYHRGSTGEKFSVVRYGNVFNSRGSVVPVFLNKVKTGKKFEITDPKMTRFNITLDEGVNFVGKCLEIMEGGELFVPKLSSFNITDLAKAIDEKKQIKIIGIRSGEKIHEEMISDNESNPIIDVKDFYVLLPDMKMVSWSKNKYLKIGKQVKEKFSYTSDNNKKFLNIKELKKLIKGLS
tara:strand:+ start:2079 stop:3065 length:987 start_codon:yes stop_codon:yes gene_type:complete